MDRMFKSLTKANPLLSLLAVVLLLPCMAFFAFMAGVGIAVNTERTQVPPEGYTAGYSVIDTLDMPGNERVSAFLADSGSLAKLKALYQGFVGREGMTYAVLSKQPIITQARTFPLPFAYGYGDLLDRDLNASALNTVQMNAAALSCADIRLKEGRLFEAEDYQINAELPILVGSAYMDELAIGDSFSGDYLGVLFTFRVVGILEQGSSYPSHKHVPLDRAIVMPALEGTAPLSAEETRFQQKLYLDHTNGYIFTDKGIFSIQSEVDDLCRSAGISPYILVGMPQFKIGTLGFAASFTLLFFISAFAFLLSALLLMVTLWKKVKTLLSDTKAGENRKTLYAGLYLEAFLWLLPATALSLLGFAVLFPQKEILGVIVLLAAVLWGVLPLPVIFRLRAEKGDVYNAGKNKTT